MATCLFPSPAPRIPARGRRRGPVARWGVWFAATMAAAAGPALAQSRGELLYTTHCISCHTTEMHWRDKRAASDWSSLKFQVRRWQSAASLGWTEGDVVEVARYLNETIYRFASTTDPVSSVPADVGPSTVLALRAPPPTRP